MLLCYYYYRRSSRDTLNQKATNYMQKIKLCSLTFLIWKSAWALPKLTENDTKRALLCEPGATGTCNTFCAFFSRKLPG
jgi:hypothetical protein